MLRPLTVGFNILADPLPRMTTGEASVQLVTMITNTHRTFPPKLSVNTKWHKICSEELAYSFVDETEWPTEVFQLVE